MDIPFKSCALAGCNNNASNLVGGRRGYCNSHRKKLMRRGKPLPGSEKSTAPGSLHEWIDTHVEYEGDKCLIWPFERNWKGYARVIHDGVHTNAARVMCEKIHGAPPSPEHQAAHSCGNGFGGCIHPRHLYWATADINAQEKVEHGTDMRGEKHFAVKLTEDEVREIRSLRGAESGIDLSNRFCISRTQVSAIQLRKSWTWLP